MEPTVAEARRTSTRIATRRRSILLPQNAALDNITKAMHKISEASIKSQPEAKRTVSKSGLNNSPKMIYAKNVLNSILNNKLPRVKRPRPLESPEEIQEFYERTRKKFKPSELVNSLETIHEEPVVRNGTEVIFGNRKFVRKLDVSHKNSGNKKVKAKMKIKVQKFFGKGRPRVAPIPL